MATEREQRVMDAARAMVRDQDAGRPLAPGLLALVGAVTPPDDTRAQAGECDVAAIGARLHAIDREGVRSIDDALVMGAAITDPSTGDVEWILRHAPDVIDCLADAVRRFTAAAAADAFADRVRACHAAAARVERYTLPAEVLALIADVPVLLDALAREREAHAAEVAAVDALARIRALLDAAPGHPGGIEDFRVITHDHTEHRVRVEQTAGGDEPLPWTAFLIPRPGFWSGATRIGAVLGLADVARWEVREIVAPGEWSARERIDAAVRAETARCARIVEGYIDRDCGCQRCADICCIVDALAAPAQGGG